MTHNLLFHYVIMPDNIIFTDSKMVVENELMIYGNFPLLVAINKTQIINGQKHAVLVRYDN